MKIDPVASTSTTFIHAAWQFFITR